MGIYLTGYNDNAVTRKEDLTHAFTHFLGSTFTLADTAETLDPVWAPNFVLKGHELLTSLNIDHDIAELQEWNSFIIRHSVSVFRQQQSSLIPDFFRVDFIKPFLSELSLSGRTKKALQRYHNIYCHTQTKSTAILKSAIHKTVKPGATKRWNAQKNSQLAQVSRDLSGFLWLNLLKKSESNVTKSKHHPKLRTEGLKKYNLDKYRGSKNYPSVSETNGYLSFN